MKKYRTERELLDDLLGVPTRQWEVFDRSTSKPLKKKRQRNGLPPGDPRHGTTNGYNNHDCRCVPCKAAWAEYVKAKRRARGVLSVEDRRAQSPVIHNANRYSKGCRCPVCREAATARRREARRRAGLRQVAAARRALADD